MPEPGLVIGSVGFFRARFTSRNLIRRRQDNDLVIGFSGLLGKLGGSRSAETLARQIPILMHHPDPEFFHV
jgi:hypothetical protein